MSNEELANAIKAGCKEMVPVLWGQVERFVYLKANDWYWQHESTCIRCGVALDDLKQTAYFAFLDAIQYYKATDGYKFLTYLHFPLKNRFNDVCGIRTEAQTKRPLNRYTSLSAIIPGDTEGLTYEDTIIDEAAAEEFQRTEDSIYTEQLHNTLEECLATIPLLSAAVLRERHYNQLSRRAIGEKMGVREATVIEREIKGLRALRAGKNRKRLEAFRDDIISHCAYRSSFTLWKNTGMSSTEWAVIKLEQEELRRRLT